MKRKILTAIAVVLGVFVVLSIALYGYLKSDHAESMIIRKINTVIPGTLAIGDIDFSIFDSNIQFINVQLKDREKKHCFKFNSLLIDINIHALFKKELEVTIVSLKKPDVFILMDADGRINLLDAVIPESTEKVADKEDTTSSSGLPFNVIVKKIELLDGTISFQNPEAQVGINALDILLTDVNLMDQELALTTRFSKSSIKIMDKDISIDGLQLVSNIKNGSNVDFTFDLDSSVCKINAKGLAKNIQKIPEIDLDATINSTLEQLNPFLTDQVSMGGVANITLSGKGFVDDPMISLKLDVTDLKLDEDINDGAVNVAVMLEDRIVSIEKGLINLLGNTITMKGSIDCKDVFPNGFLSSDQPALDLLKYNLEFDQSNQSLKPLEKWVPGISGRSTSSGRIKGHGINPKTLVAQVQSNLDLKDFKQATFETDFIDASVELNGNIENGLVTLTALNAKTIETQASVTGQFNIAENLIDATIKVIANDLAAATLPLGITDISGTVASMVQIKGGLSNPEVKVKMSGETLKARGIALDEFQFDGLLDTSGKAALQKLDIQGPHMSITGTGTSQVFENNFKLKDIIKSSFEISGININPGKFLEGATLDINTEQLDTLINFKLNMDMDYAIDTSFGKIDFSTIDIPIKKIAAGIDLGKKNISVVLGNIVTLKAGLDSKENQYDADMTFDNSDFTRLIQSAGINGINIQLNGQIDAAGKMPVELSDDVINGLNSAHGTINLDAEMSGKLKEPEFKVTMNLSELAYDLGQAGIAISDVNGSLVATPEKIVINALKTKLNGGYLNLDGNVTLDNYTVQKSIFNLTAANLDIPVSPQTDDAKKIKIDKIDTHLELNLDYQAIGAIDSKQIQNKAFPLKNLMGLIDLDRSKIAMTFDKTIRMNAFCDPETAEYDINLKFEDTLLDPIFAYAGLKDMVGNLKGHMIAKGNLAEFLPAEALESLKQVSGKIQLDAVIKGNAAEPDVNASLGLVSISYPIPEAGLTISQLNGTINVSDKALIIDNIDADLSQGHLNLNGAFELKNFKPVKGKLRLKSDQIAFEVPDMAQVELSTDLTFSGTADRSDLSGTILFSKADYYKDIDIDLTSALSEKKRKTSSGGKQTGTGIPLFDKMTLNIDIDYKDPFSVDNNLAFILMEPDVNITGTAVNPVITGRAKIIEGTIVYQKKEFEIDTGIIDFVDPYKIDPDINLAAKTEIRDWDINLKISGKTDNLNFQLFSDPQETHEDILSLLIAGKTTKELGKGDGSYTDVLVEKASDVIGKNVEDSTPLDSFKVGYGGAGDSKGSNVSVSMGKKLSKRLEVIYSMETKDEENVQTTAAEYKLLENFIIKAVNDSKGDFGTEFTYKLEFR